MEYLSCNTYPCDKIRDIGQVGTSFTLDIVMKSKEEQTPVARLFKAEADGVRVHLEGCDLDAQVLLQVCIARDRYNCGSSLVVRQIPRSPEAIRRSIQWTLGARGLSGGKGSPGDLAGG